MWLTVGAYSKVKLIPLGYVIYMRIKTMRHAIFP